MLTKKFKITVDEKPKKISLKLDLNLLNMIIGCIFKQSSQINRKSLGNMKKLFDIIDTTIYIGNDKLESRLFFIQKALEARVTKGFENIDMIINYCRTDTFNKDNDEIIKSIEIYKRVNYEEIKFINKAIQDRLKYSYILDIKDKMYNVVEKIDSGDFNSFQDVNDELVGLCSHLLNKTRKTNVLDDVSTFSLDADTFDNNVTDIVNKLRDPSRILKTGIQKLNQILAPGFLSKRLYMFLGLPA